jgi:hypothetical protein
MGSINFSGVHAWEKRKEEALHRRLPKTLPLPARSSGARTWEDALV